MDGVTIRAARSSDWNRFAEIIHGDPDAVALAISGSALRARRFGAELVRLDSRYRSRATMAAVLDGQVVAVFAFSTDNDRASRVYRVAHLRMAMRVFGPFAMPGWVLRSRARQRVQPALPMGCFYVAEIDVDPAYRGRGIGSDILRWAEREALRLGYGRMTLRVTLGSPAVRFYERNGFTIVNSITEKRYDALTGTPGRALMHKELAPLSATIGSPEASRPRLDERAHLERASSVHAQRISARGP